MKFARWRTKNRREVRFNLNAKAWLRLRKVYADQPISLTLDLQNRIAGVWLSALERMAYGLSKARPEPPEIIFVIGHWRSGTSFLHELLCCNPSFNFPTTYACMNPQVFPITEAAILRFYGRQSVTRPMDSMSISLASPQEDEFALLALGAPSPYEGLLFPGELKRSMRVADPDDMPEAQKQEWIHIFTRFLGQVATRKPGFPVVVKSPTHSYRVKLLAQLFPHARFIHIVRNPLEVYNSTLNMWKKLWSLYTMTDRISDDALAEQVIANGIRLEEKLDLAIPKLSEKNYIRVHYENLTAHPVEEIKRIYAELGLDGFISALPHIEGYLATRTNFEKNRFELAPDKANAVYVAWRRIFEKYGYPASSWPA